MPTLHVEMDVGMSPKQSVDAAIRLYRILDIKIAYKFNNLKVIVFNETMGLVFNTETSKVLDWSTWSTKE